jgi:hypothetical protein
MTPSPSHLIAFPSRRPTSLEVSRLAVDAVDVVERFTGDQRCDPIHQLHAVDLLLVERLPLEDPVAIAGCGLAVHDRPSVLDRRLVRVEQLDELRWVHTDQLRALRCIRVVGPVEAWSKSRSLRRTTRLRKRIGRYEPCLVGILREA